MIIKTISPSLKICIVTKDTTKLVIMILNQMMDDGDNDDDDYFDDDVALHWAAKLGSLDVVKLVAGTQTLPPDTRSRSSSPSPSPSPSSSSSYPYFTQGRLYPSHAGRPTGET